MGFDCAACKEAQKVEYGCEQDSPIPDKWTLYDYKFQRCPVKMLTPEVNQYIYAFNMMKIGFLPSPGGWAGQANKFLEAIQILATEGAKNGRKKQT